MAATFYAASAGWRLDVYTGSTKLDVPPRSLNRTGPQLGNRQTSLHTVPTPEWKSFTLPTVAKRFIITILNQNRAAASKRITLDGVPQNDCLVPLCDDRQSHHRSRTGFAGGTAQASLEELATTLSDF